MVFIYGLCNANCTATVQESSQRFPYQRTPDKVFKMFKLRNLNASQC